MKKFCRPAILAIIALLCAFAFAFAACNGNDTPSAQITVSFTVDGTVYETTEVKPGAAIPENPQKSGFVFVGWFLDDVTFLQPFSKLSDAKVSVTVYAKWAAAEQKLAVVNDGVYGGNVCATIDADHTKFIRLSLNNKTVDPSNYTVTAGSTVITFSQEYIKTLKDGEHVFLAEFEGIVQGVIELPVIYGMYGSADLVIPAGATIIKPFEFINSGVKSVAIPASVTVIGDGAFYGCGRIKILFAGSVRQWFDIKKGYSSMSHRWADIIFRDIDTSERQEQELMIELEKQMLQNINDAPLQAYKPLLDGVVDTVVYKAIGYWARLKDNPVSEKDDDMADILVNLFWERLKDNPVSKKDNPISENDDDMADVFFNRFLWDLERHKDTQYVHEYLDQLSSIIDNPGRAFQLIDWDSYWDSHDSPEGYVFRWLDYDNPLRERLPDLLDSGNPLHEQLLDLLEQLGQLDLQFGQHGPSEVFNCLRLLSNFRANQLDSLFEYENIQIEQLQYELLYEQLEQCELLCEQLCDIIEQIDLGELLYPPVYVTFTPVQRAVAQELLEWLDTIL